VSKRYLLVKVISERPISKEEFASAVVDSVRKNFGEIGLSSIDPKVIRYDGTRSKVILGCNSSAAAELQAAVALMFEASGAPILPLVVGVSGTIKALGKRSPR
jgi:RNase P/RNase MRP subunit POP5